MRRCAACRRPCPEGDLHCAHCGAALPRLEPKPLAGLFFSLADVKAAALGGLLMLMLRTALAPLLVQQVYGRSEPRLIAFYLALGAGCGLVLGRLRRDSSFWVFGVAGLAGGLGAWALDYFYNYEGLVYKAVWWVVFWIINPSQAQSAHAPYGILQGIRFLAPALALLGASLWLPGRARPTLWRALPCLGLALVFYYHLRGALLLGLLGPDFAAHGSLVFSAFFLLFYGLAPVDLNRAK